ncbi:MAG: class I SAM-dependent methyltransferase [Candidatus Methanofastidiosa archaeon]|nr:class I SAM-dependent methyltransferase [Candidatus Methanofastidiosa archaeon]
MPKFENPTGFLGKILARGMAWGHRDFYKSSAKALDLKEDDRYLEIGFGSGLFINKYASHVSRIAGLDCSKDMVELASDINKKHVASGRAEFKQGYASSLPWGDNEFSVVAAIETFYFWPEPEVSLKEAFRVIMPGGRLVLEMAYNNDDGIDHAKHIRKMNLKLYGGEDMKEMLASAGFCDVTIEYYKGFWIPFKGHVVPKGMIAKGFKRAG